ncbi:MAG: hypothetical protein ACO2PN_05250 [Pyrobaculum sp.]|jgi:hypothetical protein
MNVAHVGVLLIGVALIIIAVLAVYVYLDARRTYPPAEPLPFYADCRGGVVVVSARVDLRDVKVVDVDGRVYCTFASIKAGAEKLCKVGNATAYLVEAGNFSRAVFCYRPVPAIPPWD